MECVIPREKYRKCRNFFDNLATLLYSRYDVVESVNNDGSAYLIPTGTKDQITYTSKPAWSFRISDHWNWFASTNKCPIETYVQCLSLDMPRERKREIPGKATQPRKGIQVAVMGNDQKYHCVYGEFFDRKTRTWGWLESDPEEIATHFI